MSVPLPPSPTAKQSVVLEHDTAYNSPKGAPIGLTLGTIDHRAAAPDGAAASATTPQIIASETINEETRRLEVIPHPKSGSSKRQRTNYGAPRKSEIAPVARRVRLRR